MTPLSLSAKKAKLLEILNRTTGRSFRVLPELGTTKLLKSFTLEEVEMALKRLMKDKWHSDRIKELSSDYLLRPTTIDKWFQLAESARPRNQMNDEPLVEI